MPVTYIVKNPTATFKYKKVSLRRGRIKGWTAAREMLLILKLICWNKCLCNDLVLTWNTKYLHKSGESPKAIKFAAS